MTGNFNNRVQCRGCWSLGTACGVCQSCEETKPNNINVVLKHPCSKTCSGYTQAREETIADFERMIESTANNESLAFNTDEIQGRDILRKELLNKIKQLKG